MVRRDSGKSAGRLTCFKPLNHEAGIICDGNGSRDRCPDLAGRLSQYSNFTGNDHTSRADPSDLSLDAPPGREVSCDEASRALVHGAETHDIHDAVCDPKPAHTSGSAGPHALAAAYHLEEPLPHVVSQETPDSSLASAGASRSSGGRLRTPRVARQWSIQSLVSFSWTSFWDRR